MRAVAVASSVRNRDERAGNYQEKAAAGDAHARAVGARAGCRRRPSEAGARGWEAGPWSGLIGPRFSRWVLPSWVCGARDRCRGGLVEA